MTRVGVISDEFWAVVEPLMPSHEGKPGRRFSDHRLILEGSRGGSVREVRGGTCPLSSGRGKRCGSAITVGRWMVPATRCSPTLPRCSGWTLRWPRISKLLSVDSTNVRAHQHSAGACSDTLATGALSDYKKSADEPDDHAIGRSRGGLTTKIHALTDQREARCGSG